MSRRRVSFFQTDNCMETIAVIEESGTITIGFARAGKDDIKRGNISCEAGMNIALGRAERVNDKAKKAETDSFVLCQKNYLRGITAKRVEQGGLKLKRFLKNGLKSSN